MIVKINQIKIKLEKINYKLSNEFPNTFVKIFISKDKNITYEIFFNDNKKKNINKFNILDGGTKDRIKRKTIKLLSYYNII